MQFWYLQNVINYLRVILHDFSSFKNESAANQRAMTLFNNDYKGFNSAVCETVEHSKVALYDPSIESAFRYDSDDETNSTRILQSLSKSSSLNADLESQARDFFEWFGEEYNLTKNKNLFFL
eukprot:GHVL01039952.1.p1 GENE.GHVL01039952.1~~GHVL01039952.1.p1  ORF type:complete len:122 (-),score=16.21 GHVL01039952.1:226-591(-)